jgi:hypothetical protein
MMGTGSVNCPVDVVCDTVVICARNGRRKVGGRIDLASRNERRRVWARRDMLCVAMAFSVLNSFREVVMKFEDPLTRKR